MFEVCIKSGTAGHSDYDNNDLRIAVIPSENIPSVGDILEFGDNQNGHYKKYLVREVQRTYNHKTDEHPFQEFIRVYVIYA